MGNSIGICCKKCDYMSVFMLQIGMNDFFLSGMDTSSYRYYCIYTGEYTDFVSEESILRNTSQTYGISEEVIKLLQKGEALIEGEYGYKIYACPKCNDLSSQYHVCWLYDGKINHNHHYCEKCESLLEIFDINKISKYACPSCGNFNLQQDYSCGYYDWD